MKWENLRNNKCPQCGGALYSIRSGLQVTKIACTKTKKCTFSISPEKMEQIVMQRNAKALEQPMAEEAPEGRSFLD